MANYTESIYETLYSKGLPFEKYGGGNTSLYRSYRIFAMNDHLLYSKTQNVIDELNHIRTFINELERHGFKKSKVHNQIDLILEILESNTLSPEHTRTVNTLTKYLNGIKEFLSINRAKGVLFYKRLFESTLVAIMQDLYPPKRKIVQY